MQGQPRKAQFTAVDLIAQDGMPEIVQMHAQLMRASGLRKEGDRRIFRIALKHFIDRMSRLGLFFKAYSHLLAVPGVPLDRHIHDPLVKFDPAFDQGDITALDGMSLELPSISITYDRIVAVGVG